MSFDKAISIGLKSGEYGGKNRSRAPTFSIASRTPLILWAGKLSMTTMSPGRSSGARTCSSTFGLAIVMRGLAQLFFTPDYRSIQHAWTSGRTLSVGGVYVPAPQLVGALASAAAFGGLFLLITRTDFGKALEATRGRGRSRSSGSYRNRVFMLGWGLGSSARRACGCRDGDVLLHLSRCRASFALIAYVTVALGGFGSVFGALAAGVIVGLVEATTAMLVPPSLKSVGVYAATWPSSFFGREACSGRCSEDALVCARQR